MENKTCGNCVWGSFLNEDEKVYFFEPLEKEISVEDMQKIVDANEKLVKELKDGDNRVFREL